MSIYNVWHEWYVETCDCDFGPSPPGWDAVVLHDEGTFRFLIDLSLHAFLVSSWIMLTYFCYPFMTKGIIDFLTSNCPQAKVYAY